MLSIFAALLGVGCLVYALFPLRGKGPLLFAPLGVKGMDAKKLLRGEYRAMAALSAGLGICFLTFALTFWLELAWLGYVAIALTCVVVMYALVFGIRSMFR